MFGLDQAGFGRPIAAAGKIEPGPTGLLTLDYWQGNRVPYRAPNLRGAVLGLSLRHDRAGLYRSAVDAVALGSANVVGDLIRQGVVADRRVIAGGICKNPLWLTAVNDAMDMPADVCESGGLLLVGGAGSTLPTPGRFPDTRMVSLAPAAPMQARVPYPARHAHYVDMIGVDTIGQYREATELFAPLSRCIAIRAKGGTA